MASPNHTLPSPDISDVMNLLITMKKQNDEAMKEILTKLTRIEDDNRKLRQELLELKIYQNLNSNNNNVKVPSRKRDDAEYNDEAEDQHGTQNNEKVIVLSLPEPEPELVHALEPPASFNTLDDDCLGNVLDFVGKSCYSVFGSVNKRCHEMFCSTGLPKVTFWYGYAPIRLILQRQVYFYPVQEREREYVRKLFGGVMYYNRRDIFEWILTDESYRGHDRLMWFCHYTIQESRLEILREVFDRVNEEQLEYLRYCYTLCAIAACYGKLECLKLLRENECEWDWRAWNWGKRNGHNHIREYLQNNDYPTEWLI